MIVGQVYINSRGLFIPLMEADMDGNRVYLRFEPNNLKMINGLSQPFFNQKANSRPLQRTSDMLSSLLSSNAMYLEVRNDLESDIKELISTYIPFTELPLSIGDSYQYLKENKQFMVVLFTERDNYNRTSKNTYAFGVNLSLVITTINGALNTKTGITSIIPSYAKGEKIYANKIIDLISAEADLAYWTIDKPKPSNVLYIKQKKGESKFKQIEKVEVDEFSNDKFFPTEMILPSKEIEETSEVIKSIPTNDLKKLFDFKDEYFRKLEVEVLGNEKYESWFFQRFGFGDWSLGVGSNDIAIVPSVSGYGYLPFLVNQKTIELGEKSKKIIIIQSNNMFLKSFSKSQLKDLKFTTSYGAYIDKIFFVTPPIKRIVGDFYTSSITGKIGVGDLFVDKTNPQNIKVVIGTNYLKNSTKEDDMVILTMKKSDLEKYLNYYYGSELVMPTMGEIKIERQGDLLKDKNWIQTSALNDRIKAVKSYDQDNNQSSSNAIFEDLKSMLGDAYNEEFLQYIAQLPWGKIADIRKKDNKTFELIMGIISDLYVDFILENPNSTTTSKMSASNNDTILKLGYIIDNEGSMLDSQKKERFLRQGFSEDLYLSLLYAFKPFLKEGLPKLDSLTTLNRLWLASLGLPNSSVINEKRMTSSIDSVFFAQNGYDLLVTERLGLRQFDNRIDFSTSFVSYVGFIQDLNQYKPSFPYFKTIYGGSIMLYVASTLAISRIVENENNLEKIVGRNAMEEVKYYLTIRTNFEKVAKKVAPISINAYGYEFLGYLNKIGLLPNIWDAYANFVEFFEIIDTETAESRNRVKRLSFNYYYLNQILEISANSSKSDNELISDLLGKLDDDFFYFTMFKDKGKLFKESLESIGIDFGNVNAPIYNPKRKMLGMEIERAKMIEPTQPKVEVEVISKPMTEVETPIGKLLQIEPPIIEPPIVEPPKPKEPKVKKQELQSKYEDLDLDF